MILEYSIILPAKNLTMLGLVKGNVIQSKHVGKDLTAGLKTLVGGELKAYTEMMNEVKSHRNQTHG